MLLQRDGDLELAFYGGKTCASARPGSDLPRCASWSRSLPRGKRSAYSGENESDPAEYLCRTADARPRRGPRFVAAATLHFSRDDLVTTCCYAGTRNG